MTIQNHHIENEYISRINKVFDYIEKNIEKQFTLEELASIAYFSKFHFHRIFQGIVGETPFQFILRLRLEKAANLIVSNPKSTITEIAYKCGFTDISIFSRNFKNHFSKTASQYRKENSNLSQVYSKIHQEHKKSYAYFCYETNSMKWKTSFDLNKSVEIKRFPTMTVAYIRHIGPYKSDGNLFGKLWKKLFTWAGPRGLVNNSDFKSLTVYHDDPNITDEQKLRTSICITVPENTIVEGEIGKMYIEAGEYMVARFELTDKDYENAWQWVFGYWFPTSGYQPDDLPCLEIYPKQKIKNKIIVDICVPVKPI